MKHSAGEPYSPPHDLRSILGTKRAYQELGHQVDFMIALLDEMAGDPDLEDSDGDLAVDDSPCDDIGMDVEAAYPEWHTLPAADRRAGRNYGRALESSGWQLPMEDDEDSDPKEDDDSDYCLAGEDRIVSGFVRDPELRAPARWAGEDDDAEHTHQRAYTGPLELSAGRQAANDA